MHGGTLAKRGEADYLPAMLLGMIGTMEVVILLAIVLLIFGPSKLPQLGEGIGKMLRGFKKEMKGIEDDAGTKRSGQLADGTREEIIVEETRPSEGKVG
jgi:sec-independent protein translocase protein TatA